MRSLYAENALTRKGQTTRSKILLVLAQQNRGLTRNEIVEHSDLSYEQVRNQTQNLIEDRKIRSQIQDGQRRYYLIVAIFLLFVPVISPMVDDDSVSDDRSELCDS